MISPILLSPHIQDGDHYVKRPPPRSENHLHDIIIMLLKLFFQSNLEYISIANFFIRMCLSTQNPTWLPYWLALLAQQVPRLSDVQLLFHMGI